MSVDLRNVSDAELVTEMEKRFVIMGLYYKDYLDLQVDGLEKYSCEEINKQLTLEGIDEKYLKEICGEIRGAIKEFKRIEELKEKEKELKKRGK
jgi:hypothetical protein